MAAKIIDGKAFAAGIVAEVTAEVASIRAAGGRAPGLAVVLVGEDPASQVYVRNKGRTTKESGMESFEFRLGVETTEQALLSLIAELNDDEAVDGILVQLPLPSHINSARVLDAISPDKDVDGFHVINAGRLATGLPGLVPCTPLGCLLMLKAELGDLSGLRAVVLGRSNIVGKPMAALLLAESCTVTIAHSRTRDLEQECQRADILVAAVGRAEMVRGSWIKPGATVIDVGINRIAGDAGKTKLVGDVAFAEAVAVAGRITPVPGGVGPMTIACLLRNTLTAAKLRRG
ncbi:bifunctional methylenetetrahydrofolate dehydrogenase/methenyltetrahydrofolate cyclohydrolase FolD [Acidisoma cellulosilytica]|uniref:Bifunctional protein FolD n=1 Tax=Acidisoma cellulosilyticum TaxID=2802395 RepID=A0A963YZI6_9PROT|nr:bifunctional methylenetetrahydrofolate dehydrogenase/methenyltetrahydrofolate cyclohydrolase FolD [Acidisoma cellulosilyticum]MCB8879237.1 bifunctional methylenetetrahydrofolate dehydrogenase/methenyltetrahydrofolate cyclohydrolase FolD [Acidisoma cellulosilyticum]